MSNSKQPASGRIIPQLITFSSFFPLFTELETSRAIPVPQDVMGKIITAARVGSVIPVDVAVKGYTVCMERVIKFASMVDFFKE